MTGIGSSRSEPACAGAGEQVRGSRYGRRKLYVNHAHEERAGYRRRKKARAAA